MLFYVGAAYTFGSLDFTRWKLSSVPGQQQNPFLGPPTDFDMNVLGYDTQDPTAALVEGTEFNCYWYVNNQGGWQRLGVGDVTVNLPTGANLYAQVSVNTGNDYYADFVSTQGKNSRVTSAQYVDINDGLGKQFMFQINLNGIQSLIGANPSFYFYPYFYAYQLPTLNTPANETAVGTATVTKYVEWKATFTDAKKAWAVGEVQISINTTNISKIQLQNINIPGVGYVSGSEFGAPVQGTGTLTWTKIIGTNFYSAGYMALGNNALNNFPLTTQLQVTLASGDVVGVTITIYGLSTTGALIDSLTNTVVYAA